MSLAESPKPLRFECPSCYERMQVPFVERYSTFTCPRCGRPIQLANHQVFWANLTRAWWPDFRRGCWKLSRQVWTWWCQYVERRRAKRSARIRRKRQAAEAASERQLAIQRAHRSELQQRAHYQAVIAGQAFDVGILVEEMKNDWVALQQLGLSEVRIRQGFKAASPVTGVGSWLLGAPPWMAALIGLGTYFASGGAGEEYVTGKLLEWRAKWARILGNLSAPQLWEFSQALQERYPMVYGSLESMNRALLL